jgi:negative regulator of flagellin synthesis FlgM
MRIPSDIPKIQGIYEKQQNLGRVDKVGSVASKKDVVSISGQAKDFQTVLKALKDVPDIRADKVNSLEQKYRAGNYSVDGSDVADKVIKSIFDKKA